MSAETLREAARLMREEWAVRGEAEFCQCEESDHWFDRSICPEPCGAMHDVCVECARIKGFCAVAVESRRNSNRLAASWLAVADLLDIVEAGYVEYDPDGPGADSMHFVCAWADNLARAYLGSQP